MFCNTSAARGLAIITEGKDNPKASGTISRIQDPMSTLLNTFHKQESPNVDPKYYSPFMGTGSLILGKPRLIDLTCGLGVGLRVWG